MNELEMDVMIYICNLKSSESVARYSSIDTSSERGIWYISQLVSVQWNLFQNVVVILEY